MGRKRFTDADKWEDSWFCEQPTIVKLFWLYLCDRCDHAGVWDVNWKLAKFHLGDFDQAEVERAMTRRAVPIKDGRKWFVPGFIKFQYPTGLSSNSPAHRRIRATLTAHGVNPDTLCYRVQTTLSDTPEDKEMEKDRDSISTEDEVDRVLAAVEASNAQPIPVPLRTLGDWQAIHSPSVLVRFNDQDQARALFALYQWDCWSAAHAVVAPKARKERRAVYLSEIKDWLAANAQLEAADYERAGIPMPAQKG